MLPLCLIRLRRRHELLRADAVTPPRVVTLAWFPLPRHADAYDTAPAPYAMFATACVAACRCHAAHVDAAPSQLRARLR